jgi:hypothetical protein
MGRGSVFSVAVLGGALLAPPALAQDEPAPGCLNAGQRYQLGEFACIAVCHQQRRLARCDMFLNNTSWTYVSESCPDAMIINPPWPSDWTEVPVVTSMSPKPVKVTYSAFPPEMPLTLAAFRN